MNHTRLAACLLLVLAMAHGHSAELKKSKNHVPKAKKAEPAKKSSNWDIKRQFAINWNQTAVQNAGDSRDPAIQNLNSNWHFIGEIKTWAKYKADNYSLEHLLNMRYGQSETRYYNWQGDRVIHRSESEDIFQLEFIQARHITERPFELYTSERFDSAFTGVEPGGDPRDDTDWWRPQLLKFAAGIRTKIFDNLTVSVGPRTQEFLDEPDEGLEIGLEGILDYRRVFMKNSNYTGKLEMFSEFEDVNHVTMRFDNALNWKLNSVLTVRMSWLLYYETNPEMIEGPAEDRLYNLLSWKQTSRIGMVFQF